MLEFIFSIYPICTLILLLVFGLYLGRNTSTVGGALWRHLTGIRIQSTPTHLVTGRKSAPPSPIGPVVMDVKDWAKVRELEQEAYGCHYHRLDGTTNDLGWESLEAEEAEARSKADSAEWYRRMLAADGEKARAAQIREDGMRELAEEDRAAAGYADRLWSDTMRSFGFTNS